MTLDAFLHKYRLILTDEQKEDLIELVKFIQAEARLAFQEHMDRYGTQS